MSSVTATSDRSASHPGWVEHVEALARPRGLSTSPGRSCRFRLGDVCLQVASGGSGFLEEFEARYRDCIVAQPHPDLVDVRCHASRLAGSSLLCLSFDGARLPDPIGVTGTQFRVLRHLSRYVDLPGPVEGWRMLVDGGSRDRPLLASDGRRIVVDLDQAPAEFATDCVVSLAQAVQKGVLFLHSASVGVAGAGGLLVGFGQAGKSTTALALAARGNMFLGDDVAAIRVATRELLPFPKTMRLRPGPYVDSLGARLRETRHTISLGDDGLECTHVSMGDLFPASVGRALPLRFAFLLEGFGPRPRLTPYRPGIVDAKRLRGAITLSIPYWGLSPGRDLMRFLAVVNLLSRVDCYLLELGSPGDSASAIEERMEAACRST